MTTLNYSTLFRINKFNNATNPLKINVSILVPVGNLDRSLLVQE